MAQAILQTFAKRKTDRMLLFSAVIMAVSVLSGLTILGYSGGVFDSIHYFYLFPWIFSLLILLAVPIAIVGLRGWVGIENPLMVGTVSYFIPAFVLGGLSLCLGLSQPYFLSFIQDPAENLPYTMSLIMLGYSGLAVGYYLPLGRKLAISINRLLPKDSGEQRSYVVPGIFILGVGFASSIYATATGIIGFQRTDESSIFDGIIYLTTLFAVQGNFLLWSHIFRQPEMNIRSWLLIVLLVAAILATSLIAGNRGSLFAFAVLIAMSFILSGRKITGKLLLIGSSVLAMALIGGMVYGSVFRAVKGSEDKVGFDQYAGYIGETISTISNGDKGEVIGSGFTSLAQRLDTVSSLAVVVSNYEQLAPYEEGYGLDNNIYKDLTSFIVPRVFWPDKPVASDSRAYSDLYFDYPDNSFAITPIGDLLRNYGASGVLIGMLALGVILRFIYRVLIEDQPNTIWRSTLYYMLLSAVSYEGFYGTILPMIVKVGVVATFGVIISEFLAHRISSRGFNYLGRGHTSRW